MSSPTPVTLGELASVERVQPPSMTRIVAGLEEAGLVIRKVDDRDRRIARVETTVAGQRFLERHRGRKNAYLAARVRTLGAEDRAVLARAATLLTVHPTSREGRRTRSPRLARVP